MIASNELIVLNEDNHMRGLLNLNLICCELRGAGFRLSLVLKCVVIGAIALVRVGKARACVQKSTSIRGVVMRSGTSQLLRNFFELTSVSSLYV